ncbi:MAG TPA: hypothetical protein VNL91_05070 [Thermoanaerobaculia bacterium]|nr:hypothetical protein [Thermoanaerobaculia bacterium]
MDTFVVPLVATIFGMTAATIIVLSLIRSSRRKAELRAEVQTRLIERFGSGAELSAFLNSEEGREFIAGVQSMPALLTRQRVISSVRNAIIMAALGLAFCAIWIIDDNVGMMYPGIIMLALGLGTYAAAMMTRRLAAEKGAAEQV